MKTLHTEIDIDAPAERVWDILTNIADYSLWNEFIPHMAGSLAPGERLEIRIEPPGGAAMTFRPTVLAVEPGRELRWVGRLLIPGLFDGEHQFEIRPLGRGRVRFVQQERFTGMLVPLFARNLDDHTLRGFNAMNAALKLRAEGAVGIQPVVAGLDPARYAGHSLRAGLATSAAAGGASERDIMNQTGHRSSDMVRRYIREGNLFHKTNAASLAGL